MTTRPPTDPFESELRAAMHRLAPPPTEHLLDGVLRATDSMPRRSPGWRLFSWPSLAAASAVAIVMVIAIGLAGLPRGGFDNRGVAPTVTGQVTPSTTAVPSALPTASPLPTPKPAPVLARIRLPHPDAQTAFNAQVAVTDHAVWSTGFRSTNLVQISTVTNSVVSDVPVDYASLAAAGGVLWTLGPAGLIPGPDHEVLSRVDLSTGVPQAIASVSPNSPWDAGLGGVWVVVDNSELWLLDGTTGDVLRRLSPPGGLIFDISVGCESLWAWRSGDGADEVLQLDPETGEVLNDFRMPEGALRPVVEMDGSCWTLGDRSIYRLGQDGEVDESRLSGYAWIAGGSVWTIQNDVLERIEPSTGKPVGTAWRLPQQDVRVDIPKVGVDWQLLSTDGSLWLLRGDELIRYGIPAS